MDLEAEREGVANEDEDGQKSSPVHGTSSEDDDAAGDAGADAAKAPKPDVDDDAPSDDARTVETKKSKLDYHRNDDNAQDDEDMDAEEAHENLKHGGGQITKEDIDAMSKENV